LTQPFSHEYTDLNPALFFQKTGCPLPRQILPFSWQLLCNLEQAQGNATAAKDARDQAVALYKAFRRSSGGKYEYGARLCAMVGDAIQRGARAAVEAAFGQFGGDFQPLIDALRQILDGVRDVQVVEGLPYNIEVDVRLLLAQLGA